MTTTPSKLEGPIPITADSGAFHGTNAQPIPGRLQTGAARQSAAG